MCIRDSDESVGVVNTDRETDQVNKNKTDQMVDNKVNNDNMSESDCKMSVMDMLQMIKKGLEEYRGVMNKGFDMMDKRFDELHTELDETKEVMDKGFDMMKKHLNEIDKKWGGDGCQLKANTGESKQVSVCGGSNITKSNGGIVDKVSGCLLYTSRCV